MAELAELRALIAPELEALGFEFVRLQFIAGADEPTLQLMAERPETGQLTIEDCAELSRRISEKFDEADPIEHAYRLEVSSPGIDRPLTRAKDYANWAGHEARINLIEAVAGKKQLRGPLCGIEGEQIVIEDRKAGEQRVALDNVHSAKLILTDALIDATGPLPDAGADEYETDDLTEEQED